MATIKIPDYQENICITDKHTDFTNEMIERYEKFTKATIKAIKKNKWKNGLKRRR